MCQIFFDVLSESFLNFLAKEDYPLKHIVRAHLKNIKNLLQI